jgi:hypothetical protein
VHVIDHGGQRADKAVDMIFVCDKPVEPTWTGKYL